MFFTKNCDVSEIEFTSLVGCIHDYFKDKFGRDKFKD